MQKIFAIALNIPILAMLVVLFSADSAKTESFDFFENRIRPSLVKYCYPCHSGLQVKGNLRLDSKSGWVVGGNKGRAIVPYHPSNSLLMTAINYQDPNLSMPPKGKLPKEVIDDFSVVVSYEDIEAKNYSMSAGQYFEVKIEYVDITQKEFDTKMEGFTRNLENLFSESSDLEKEIKKQLSRLKHED